MNKIQQLPENLINKIAAGEVIERPASVVKELIENSIDAKATNIEIELENGGKKSITVIDNGIGMSQVDAKLCFKLHTTSKLKTIEDLNNIFTLGFRGEAIASISAVSETTIHTKAEKSDAIKLVVENSKLVSEEFIPRSKGTTIRIQDVFRHLPARKKFLKGDSTEYRYALNEITKVAISYPEVSIKLTHNQKEVLELDPTSSQAERIVSIYKNIPLDKLLVVKYDSPKFQISGYIIHPSELSKDRSKQFLYLNNRFVLEKSLSKAIKDAYMSLIPPDRQPGYFLNILINPNELDVNIHPRKLEVKINNISEIFYALKKSIEHSLSKSSHVDLNSKIGNFQGAFRNTTNSKLKDEIYSYKPSPSKISDVSNTQYNIKSYTGGQNENKQKFDKVSKVSSSNSIQDSLSFTQSLLENTTQNTNNQFQILNTYIILEKSNELQIIDQHAADERVNYERMLKRIESGEFIEKQDLLIPISIVLPSEEISLLQDQLDKLSKIGLDIDIFSEDSIKINALPEFAREVNHKELISEIIETIRDNGEANIDSIIHKLAASLACHGSIRAGKKLSTQEIDKLIEDLFKCDKPYSCPHGRPIIWTLPRYEIEKKFERIK